jgi:adenylate kinase
MIIFMGVAGSGKSVQGRALADEKRVPWLSTGEFLRMLVTGDERKDMLEGKLLEDADIIALVQKVFTIIDVKDEFVLDGFPRTIAQAEWLLGQIKFEQLGVTAVINIQVDEHIVRQRLIVRGRKDDHDSAIENRLHEHRTTILPILEMFRNAGVRVVDVDGNGTEDTIHKAIIESLQ